MPPRSTEERLQRNTRALRALVNARSPRIVRDTVAGRSISPTRKKFPLPSIGHRSGKLTVTGYLLTETARRGLQALLVKCDCGAPEYMVDRHNFKLFKSTRCNICAKKSSTRTRKLYWGYADVLPDDGHRARLLNRLSSAIGRCHKKTNRGYRAYGGRGIQVCKEWREDRAAFLRHVQTLAGWDNPTLEMDRADNSKGYEPGNIQFVTRTANLRNTRKVHILQTELDDLRSRLSRAEKQIHSCVKRRSTYRT